MIFAHTWQKVLSGEKSQTRRIVKPDHRSYVNPSFTGDAITRVKPSTDYFDRDLYAVGKTYAVQPGRGKKQVARIRITDIRQEDVRQISDEDVKAEGFNDPVDFWYVWCNMHDPKIDVYSIPCGWQQALNDKARDSLLRQPADRYQAWVLEFELVPERIQEAQP